MQFCVFLLTRFSAYFLLISGAAWRAFAPFGFVTMPERERQSPAGAGASECVWPAAASGPLLQCTHIIILLYPFAVSFPDASAISKITRYTIEKKCFWRDFGGNDDPYCLCKSVWNTAAYLCIFKLSVCGETVLKTQTKGLVPYFRSSLRHQPSRPPTSPGPSPGNTK